MVATTLPPSDTDLKPDHRGTAPYGPIDYYDDTNARARLVSRDRRDDQSMLSRRVFDTWDAVPCFASLSSPADVQPVD